MSNVNVPVKVGDQVDWVKPTGQEKRLDWVGVVLKVYPENGQAAVEWRRVDGGGKLTVSLQPFSAMTKKVAKEPEAK